MRVLVIDDGVDLGGAQQVLLRLSEPLRAQGVILELVARPDAALGARWVGQQHSLSLAADRSIRGARGTVRVDRLLAAAGHSIAQSWRLARLARQTRPDVILSNSHWTHADAIVAGHATRTPSVLYLHDMAVPGIGAFLRGLLARGATRTLAVSKEVSAQLNDTRASVVPNGVDTRVFHPGPRDPSLRASLGMDDATVLAVSVARVDPIKRVERAVEAVAGVPGTHLAVVGDWEPAGARADYCREVRSLAEHIAPGRCHFVGQTSDVAGWLRAGDVLVHPSGSEGSGLAPMEALACALPVVGYDIPGVREAVLPDAGLLVSADAGVGELRAALEQIASDAQRRRAMGGAGARRVHNQFSLERQADAVAAALRKAMA